MLHYPVLAVSVITSDCSNLSKPRPLHDYIKVMNKICVDDIFINISSEIRGCKDKGIQLALLNDITWGFGDETSLWKLGFLDDYTLVYLSNRVLSDGTFAKFFASKIQNLLNQELTPFDVLLDYDHDWKSMPHLPPPVEYLLDYTARWFFLPRFLLSANIIKWFCFRGVKSGRENEHSYRLIHVDSSKLSKLLTNLRANGAIMTPFIVSCALNAMYQTVLKKSWLKLMDVVVPCDSCQ
jgi:alcohol O-acetyltransferase